ncbi:MAG: hypothetical protein ACJAQ6_000455 [Arenicella sp.]|jgi:hypothetical protein
MACFALLVMLLMSLLLLASATMVDFQGIYQLMKIFAAVQLALPERLMVVVPRAVFLAAVRALLADWRLTLV